MSEKFNFANLRASTDFEVSAAPSFNFIRITKPPKRAFFRTFLIPKQDEVYFVTSDVDGETYLVAPPIVSTLEGDVDSVILVPYVTRDAQAGLWPVKRDRAGARTNSWNASSFAAAKQAENAWVRVVSDMNMNCYRTIEALGDLGSPELPSVTYESLLERAFEERIIDDPKHPVIRRLMGEE
jgi:hypothetical protein